MTSAAFPTTKTIVTEVAWVRVVCNSPAHPEPKCIGEAMPGSVVRLVCKGCGKFVVVTV